MARVPGGYPRRLGLCHLSVFGDAGPEEAASVSFSELLDSTLILDLLPHPRVVRAPASSDVASVMSLPYLSPLPVPEKTGKFYILCFDAQVQKL